MEKEKLKTLKEIVSKINAWDKIWVEEEELRAEAVKWVKSYSHPCAPPFVADTFMDFFNLTEEDLE